MHMFLRVPEVVMGKFCASSCAKPARGAKGKKSRRVVDFYPVSGFLYDSGMSNSGHKPGLEWVSFDQ